MRQIISLVSALLASLILAGCGGGSSGGSQTPKVQFTSQVSFGDSLSDVGTYAVPAITAVGGGQFTLNGAGKNWIELMAAQLGLPAPCAAVTGGYGVAPSAHAGCNGYAQGGAMVTIPTGIGYAPANAAALTYPVSTQIANHGNFSGTEIVFVLAGANDILYQASANALAPATAVSNVAAAAGTLVTNINTIIANGAKYVVVVNVPDIANTPMALKAGAATQGFFDTLVTTFNGTLKAGLAANTANADKVLYVDAYTASRDEVTNPAAYGLTNVTGTACNVSPGSFLATNFATSSGDGSSLGCSIANPASITAGVTANTHYLFADDVHPTPYGYLQLARLVSKEMLIKGWM